MMYRLSIDFLPLIAIAVFGVVFATIKSPASVTYYSCSTNDTDYSIYFESNHHFAIVDTRSDFQVHRYFLHDYSSRSPELIPNPKPINLESISEWGEIIKYKRSNQMYSWITQSSRGTFMHYALNRLSGAYEVKKLNTAQSLWSALEGTIQFGEEADRLEELLGEKIRQKFTCDFGDDETNRELFLTDAMMRWASGQEMIR